MKIKRKKKTSKRAPATPLESGEEIVAEELEHEGLSAPEPPDVDPAKVAYEGGEPCTPYPTLTPTIRGENEDTNLPMVPDGVSLPEIVKRRRKKLTGRHLPMVHCDSCRFTQQCPLYKPGYECGYLGAILKSIESTELDPLEFMRSLAETRLTRAQQGLIFEQLSGGTLTPEVSAELEAAAGMLERMDKMERRHRGEPDPDEDGGGSLLQMLFGDAIKKAKRVKEDVQEGTVVDESTAQED